MFERRSWRLNSSASFHSGLRRWTIFIISPSCAKAWTNSSLCALTDLARKSHSASVRPRWDATPGPACVGQQHLPVYCSHSTRPDDYSIVRMGV